MTNLGFSRMVMFTLLGLILLGCDPQPVVLGPTLDPQLSVAQRASSSGAHRTLSSEDFRAIVLEVPEGSDRVGAIGINDSGVIIGSAEFDEEHRAIRWDRSGSVEVLVGFPVPTGINNRGDIIGRSMIMTRSGEMRELEPLPGGSNPVAVDINNRGDVVGTSRDEAGRLRPVIWRGGRHIVDLGTLPGHEEGSPGAINERGDVVGQIVRPGAPNLPVLWTGPGNLLELENPHLRITNFHAMNNRREFVGQFWTLGNAEFGVLNRPSEFTGAFTGINANGTLVGWSTDGLEGSGAYVLNFDEPDNRVSLPLPDPFPDCGGEFRAMGINNGGDIVGDCDRVYPILWLHRR